jgi:hypothetical protein
MTVQLGGIAPDGKIPFPLMTKGGEIYQMQSIEAWSQGRYGTMGSMSDMTSVLHQSVAINSKGGYC